MGDGDNSGEEVGGADVTRSSPPALADVPAAKPTAAPVAADEQFDDQPERYRVERRIGAGGMGIVLSAKGERLGRSVALKLIGSDREDLRRRFEREGMVTARLQHPAIVPVYGTGRGKDGRPFYAMKQVTGEPLDKLISAASSLEERLGLLPKVIAVTEAIAYAHSERVIHRDLKPANILVGAFGETVVIDWGLAKDLARDDGEPLPSGPYRGDGEVDAAGATAYGAVMGTPAYMPLEQARGESVGPAADVYALGAILYHLLAGVAPYTRPGERGVAWENMLARVVQGPPPSLDTLQPELPKDLLAIVQRAMARAPEDRYPSAGELAEDLKRFQTGQLVGAHRYSAWQLIKRWARKHRAAVIVGTLGVVALAVVGIVSIRRIMEEQARTERQRVAAVKSRDDAEDLISFMLGDLRTKLAPLGTLPAMRDTATQALDYYAKRTDGLSEQEQRKQAIARGNLSDVLLEQGDLPAALAQATIAHDLRKALLARGPSDVRRRADMAASQNQLANLLRAQGKTAAALELARAAVSTMEQLTAEQPGERMRQRDLAMGRGLLALLLKTTDPAAALRELRNAEASWLQLAATDPANADYAAGLFTARGDVADQLIEQGDLPAALSQFEGMKTSIEQTTARSPIDKLSQRRLAVVHSRISDVHARRGDKAAALRELAKSIEITRTLVEQDPTNTNWLRDLSVDLLRQGDLDPAGSDKSYAASLEISQRLAARDPTNNDWQRDLAVSHGRIGAALVARHDVAAAAPHLSASLDIRKRLAQLTPTNSAALLDLAQGYNSYAELLEDKGDAGAALAGYQQSLGLLEQVDKLTPNQPAIERELTVELDRIADVSLAKGDHDAARDAAKRSLAISERLAARNATSPSAQDDLAYGHSGLGKVLLAIHDLDGALTSLRAAQAIREKLVAAEPTNADFAEGLAHVERNLARTLAAKHDRPAALALFTSARKRFLSLYATTHNPELNELALGVSKEISACCP